MVPNSARAGKLLPRKIEAGLPDRPSDVDPYIDRARILCLTSVIEGLPTVFTEAMSLG